ncbi:MAG TPA: sodium:proton antiporter [Oculatellaceae cyanobacterium]
MIAAFLLLVVITALISMRLKIPYTLILVLLGVMTTATLTMLSVGGGPFQQQASGLIKQIQDTYQAITSGGTEGLFVGLILPPLLFEAMIHIRSDDLKTVLRPALALATVGVIIATVVCGVVLWLGFGLSPYVSFLFAAIIAPTDVVTVLEVFRRVKVPSKLATLLQTESAFNDAPAIVIFTMILAYAGMQTVTPMQATISFAYILGVGALIGLVVAFVGELLSSMFEDPVVETILAIVVVYGSFALADGLGASGLVAVSVAGLYYGIYTMRTAMDESERESVKRFWQVIAFIGNTVAFLLIGFEVDLFTLPTSILLILVAFIAVTLGRVATVYPIIHFFRKTLGEEHTKVWSRVAMLGGVRGAVSIVLTTTIAATVMLSEGDVTLIKTMVFGVAFISILIQVPMLLRYVRKNFAEPEKAISLELNEQFEKMQQTIVELNKLRAEGQINHEDYEAHIEDIKSELDEVISKSSASVPTKKIIQERSAAFFASMPVLSPLHTIAKKTNQRWWQRKKKTEAA